MGRPDRCAADFADEDDADTADLVCTDGQWAVFDTDTAAWVCDGFSDSTLSDADVVVAVGTDAVDLYAGRPWTATPSSPRTPRSTGACS